MRSPDALEISIPHPCGADWNAMRPDGNGRHCAACCKTVIDFTDWGDAAIAAFFRKPESSTACGRFRAAQLGRVPDVPHQPHSLLYRWVLAAGIAAITLTAAPAAAQTAHPPAPHTHGPASPDRPPSRNVLTPQELERMPVRSACFIVGIVRPTPSHVLPESGTNATYTGEQLDHMHLRSLDELLK